MRLLDRWTGHATPTPKRSARCRSSASPSSPASGGAPAGRSSRIRVGITIFFALLTLGPFLQVAGVNTQIPLPWSVLRYVPVLGLVRSPGRFAVLVTMVVAVLFAQALAHARPQPSRSAAPWLTAVGVLLAIELVPGPRTLYSAAIPALYSTIAADPRPDVRVLELPVGVKDGTGSIGLFDPRAQYVQTRHGKAIIGGYLSRVSPSAGSMRGARPS